LWRDREKLPNQKNAAGMMKLILTFEAQAGSGRNDMFLRVIRWCKMVEFPERFPDIWAQVKTHPHHALAKNYTIRRSEGLSAKTWWASVKSYADILLAADDWEQCINAEKEWQSVRDRLTAVSESPVGQRVFASALRSMAASSFSDMIDAALQTVAKSPARLTAVSLKHRKKQVEDQFAAHSATLHAAAKPRTVNIVYRGVTFPVQVNSFSEESDLKLSAFVKGLAVKKGVLEPLFCESELTTATEPTSNQDVDPAVLSDAVLARNQAKDLVSDAAQAGSAEIRDALVQNQRVLSSLDRHWKIELNFWLSQCGATGEV
jgi:hypothetical protein